MNAIFICGIFMSFFIVLLLATKKNKALSDKLLAAWVLIIGLHLLNYYLYQLGYWEKYPHLVGITAPFPLLHGPLLFLYTLYSLRTDIKIRLIDYLHFGPALLAYLYMTKFFFFYSSAQKAQVDSGAIPDFQVFTNVLLVSFILSGLTYPFLSYQLTRQHQRKINQNFSYDEGINLNWLRNCILAIGAVFLSAAVIVIMREGLGLHFGFNADYIFYSLIILFIFYLGYFGIRHQNMFTHNSQSIQPEPREEKYKKSGLKQEVMREVHLKLVGYMNKEKPYLDPRLTLAGLAAQLDISPNQLSQVINQQEQVNFHDFVNKYRIEEFLSRARENANFSLLGNALDSGFNSKSSFNGIFKKHKGMTPTQYISTLSYQTSST